MNADEVVKALRRTADAIKVASPVAIIMNGAADLIESLQAQLNCAKANSMIQEMIIDKQHNPADSEKIVRLSLENADLCTQLELSRERERAAVRDMKVMALAMRESEELTEGCCFACAYEAQNIPGDVILAYGECPGYNSDNCFEWRGPAGEGAGE
jgi:hypothetical protein